MTEQPVRKQTSNTGLTFRAVVLALALMPVNTYFIITNEVKYISTLATTMSLIYNVIISLTVLIIINTLIKRFFPRFALQQGEAHDHLHDALTLLNDCRPRRDANRRANSLARFLVRHP